MEREACLLAAMLSLPKHDLPIRCVGRLRHYLRNGRCAHVVAPGKLLQRRAFSAAPAGFCGLLQGEFWWPSHVLAAGISAHHNLTGVDMAATRSVVKLVSPMFGGSRAAQTCP